MQFVTVRHPDIEGTAEVSRDAYDVAYAEKGWQIVDEAVEGLDDGVTVVPIGPPAPPANHSEAPKPSDTPIGDELATPPAPTPEV